VSLAEAAPPPARAALAPGAAAALALLAVGAATLALAQVAPWLARWPEAWTLPATEWIGAGLSTALEAVKPAARAVSAVLGYPMAWVHAALTGAPWPLVCGLTVALGWRRWRRRRSASCWPRATGSRA
jgi:glycine betaine/proline transport system permease protein